MARMRLYTVHLRLWSASADREAVLLREGFSWPAFLFTFLWALRHRLWFAAVIVLGLSAALSVASDVADLDPLTDAALFLGLALAIGWEANDWRRRKMERRGFVNAGVVAAHDLTEAEQRFFSRPRGPTASS